MKFDFIKFKESIILAIKKIFLQIVQENKDDIIYSFSLFCLPDIKLIGIMANTKKNLQELLDGSNDIFWYYRLCPEEWGICYSVHNEFKEINNMLEAFQKENSDKIKDYETNVYTIFFREFRKKIFNVCIESLLELKYEGFFNSNSQENIELNFWVIEFLDEEYSINIFSKLNNGEIVDKYKKHIEEIL